MKSHEAVTELSSGIVLDRSKFPSNSESLSELLQEAYSTGRKVVIVANALSFFTATNLIKELETGGNDWGLIAEKFDIRLEESDIAVVNRSLEIRREIINKVRPKYSFAVVPDSWSVDEYLVKVGASSYKRTKLHSALADVNTAAHSIGAKQLQNIWGVASQLWAGKSTCSQVNVRTGSYDSYTAVIGASKIKIGCQTVYRFELEQLALSLNWAFPEQ